MKQPGKKDIDQSPDLSQIVEVVDDSDRPVALITLGEAHRQLLPHRSVLVLVYDLDNRIYLRKRSSAKKIYPGRWDISAGGHVLAGESRFEAAQRELWDILGIQSERLRPVADIPSGPGTGNEFVSVYSVGRTAAPPRPNPVETQGGFFYSMDEFDCLVKEFRELLTPELVLLWGNNIPFPHP